MTRAAKQLDTPALELLIRPARAPVSFDQFDRWIVAVLLAITALLYARTATMGFVNFDDNKYVYDNPHLKLGLGVEGVRWALTTGYFSYWHPLTWLVYLTTCSLFGVRAGPIHVVNFILHACNACLLFHLLRKTTGQRWPAAIVAALWAWHPLRVESVAWVAETKDVLSMFFLLLTLIAYARYARQPDLKRYLLVSATLLCALASKPMVVTLPAILLLMDYWPLNRLQISAFVKPQDDSGARSWLIVEKIPWLLMVLAVSGWAYHVQQSNRALELTRLIPLPGRLENALISVVIYIRRCFWPAHLAVFYPHPSLIGRPIPAWQWAGSLALLIAISIWAMTRRRQQPYLCIGWLWFLGTLVPMIGIVQAGEQAMADRYSLLPSIGLTIAVVWLIADRLKHHPNWRMPITFAAMASLAICLMLSQRQIGFWRDTSTLFNHANDVTEDNYLARSILANELLQSGEHLDRALELARSAVKICPSLPFSHHILAGVLDKRGDNDAAIQEYQTSASIDPRDADAPDDLGALFAKMNRNTQAIAQFRESIRINPYLPRSRHNLAYLLARNGHLDEAILQWRQAIQLDPHNGIYHGFLADALRLQGDQVAAIQQYSAALADGERKPDWESRLAWYIATGLNSSPANVQRMIPIAKDAVERTENKDAFSLDALAAALARGGQFDQAASVAQQAIACAQAQNQPRLVNAIQARLQGYRQGQAYIEKLTGNEIPIPKPESPDQ